MYLEYPDHKVDYDVEQNRITAKYAHGPLCTFQKQAR